MIAFNRVGKRYRSFTGREFRALDDLTLELQAGEVFYESTADVHTVSRNDSATEPVRLIVLYVKETGAPPTVLMQHDQQ